MKFLKKSLLTTLLTASFFPSYSSLTTSELNGAYSTEKVIEVDRQIHNVIFDPETCCKENEFIDYFVACNCDCTFHFRAVGWRHVTPQTIPQKNNGWYEARIDTKSRGKILLRSREYDDYLPTFYDIEKE